MRNARLEDWLNTEVIGKVASCASFAVGTQEFVWQFAAGTLSYESVAECTAETRFDVASLTKVVATTPAAMLLFESGALDLHEPTEPFGATPFQLLTHSSGLPPYRDCTSLGLKPNDLRKELGKTPFVYVPGSEVQYSCIGIIQLQTLIEKITGQNLNNLLDDRLWGPLGMDDTGYLPNSPESCAATEQTKPWRSEPGAYSQGRVHDPLAYLLGGISGNAGVFSTASDLARFCRWYLSDSDAVVGANTRKDWAKKRISTRALGWDTKSETGSSAGEKFSPSSFGHTGYTGTSIWIDPERGCFAVLLTNRVHPNDDNLEPFKLLRPRFHDLVIDELDRA